MDLLDDPVGAYKLSDTSDRGHNSRLTERVNLASLDALEADLIVVLVVGKARECRPDGTVLERYLKLGSKYSAIVTL